MAADRGAFLTTLAAARGVIDFREARLMDPAWWRRCRLLIAGMLTDVDATLLDSGYRFQLALIGNGNLTEASFNKSQERAQETREDLLALYRPWDGRTSQERKANEYARLRALYIQEIGDPNTPEFKARERQAQARIEANTLAAIEKQVEDANRLKRIWESRQPRPRKGR